MNKKSNLLLLPLFLYLPLAIAQKHQGSDQLTPMFRAVNEIFTHDCRFDYGEGDKKYEIVLLHEKATPVSRKKLYEKEAEFFEKYTAHSLEQTRCEIKVLQKIDAKRAPVSEDRKTGLASSIELAFTQAKHNAKEDDEEARKLQRIIARDMWDKIADIIHVEEVIDIAEGDIRSHELMHQGDAREVMRSQKDIDSLLEKKTLLKALVVQKKIIEDSIWSGQDAKVQALVQDLKEEVREGNVTEKEFVKLVGESDHYKLSLQMRVVAPMRAEALKRRKELETFTKVTWNPNPIHQNRMERSRKRLLMQTDDAHAFIASEFPEIQNEFSCHLYGGYRDGRDITFTVINRTLTVLSLATGPWMVALKAGTVANVFRAAATAKKIQWLTTAAPILSDMSNQCYGPDSELGSMADSQMCAHVNETKGEMPASVLQTHLKQRSCSALLGMTFMKQSLAAAFKMWPKTLKKKKPGQF